jgi:hypothetical protein
MDWFKQLTRPSSWMVYLSLLLTFAGRHFAEGSARYALMTAGTALLAGAIMNVISDGRKRNALACAVRKNKTAN